MTSKASRKHRGVVHEDVDPSEPFHREVDDFLAVRKATGVGLNADRRSAHLGYLFPDLVERRLASRRHHHGSPGLRHTAHDGRTYAAGATGDDRHATFQRKEIPERLRVRD